MADECEVVQVMGRNDDVVRILYAWQDARCAACGLRWRLHVDHEHKTDAVRGLLCPGCNAREPKAGDVPLWVAYRLRPPTAMLGLRARYGWWYGNGDWWPDGSLAP